VDAVDAAEKCLPGKCDHLRLSRKGKICARNGALQTQLFVERQKEGRETKRCKGVKPTGKLLLKKSGIISG
jgi:hypothetical protein